MGTERMSVSGVRMMVAEPTDEDGYPFTQLHIIYTAAAHGVTNRRMASKQVVKRAAKMAWLDLRGSGLSAIERLCLEEALLRHDPQERCWGIVGFHDPTYHRVLRLEETRRVGDASCIIVMGIGGKPERLLNVDLVRQEGPLTVKRFSGGGTVVLDHSSLWTTFIGRTALMPDIQPFPRSIMQWSADEIFSPAFSQLQQDALLQSSASSMTAPTSRLQKTLMMQGRSCGVENSGRAISMPIHNDALLSNNNNNSRQTVPDFALRENDYVMGEQKIGGNAQSIVKGGWLHHTSFLWDFEEENMNYLSLPSKRPDYRGDRPHDAFLLKLQPLYNKHHSTFFDHIQDAASAAFSELDHVTTEEALNIVDTELGGLQHYFDNKCRTKIIQV